MFTTHNKGETYENHVLLLTDAVRFQEHPGRLGTRKEDSFVYILTTSLLILKQNLAYANL